MADPEPRRLITASSNAARLAAAQDWLGRRGAAEPLLLVSDGPMSAHELLRRVALSRGALFGWQRTTLNRMAVQLAGGALAEARRSVAGQLAVEALVARVVYSAETLGRYQPLAQRPGLARALARTFVELRMARISAQAVRQVDPDLCQLLQSYERELRRAGLADRATVFRLAEQALLQSAQEPGLQAHGLLLLDLSLASPAEQAVVVALAARHPQVLATVPAGDGVALAALQRALGVEPTDFDALQRDEAPHDALARVQRYLFTEARPPVVHDEDDESVQIVSAPGESRECVELVRRVLEQAAQGVPFDRMAILLHAPQEHARHLQEALERAQVPGHFAQGVAVPDPAGRAFLALLACAAEGLSARRFAEYLSLGQLPDADGASESAKATPAMERWMPPDGELIPDAIVRIALEAERVAQQRREREQQEAAWRSDPEQAAVRAGSLRAPRRWERLLNEAAVIGGRQRWERRLDGLRQELSHRLEHLDDATDPAGDAVRRQLSELAALRSFALPLLRLLEQLPGEASWGEWNNRLAQLAGHALREPGRVLSLLAELGPMGPVGPLGLPEVCQVLSRRLTELVRPPAQRRYGAVLVAPPEAVRGLPPFDVVFVPGLSEKLFPRRILEDPVLPDEQRQRLSPQLECNVERIGRERLALRLAAGAARKRLVLSYSRLDLLHGRPRVPSFYTLETLRALSGQLPGFGELASQAELKGAARLGWPAPPRPRAAIDAAEHDLARLEQMRQLEPDEAVGALAHLLSTNSHLRRAVQFRAQRWGKRWTGADGLVRPSPAAREALAAHELGRRSYSPTALQAYASCPYKFLLQAVMRLGPRDVPEAVDDLDPLQRGALVHEAQFLLLRQLREQRLLPLGPETLEPAWERLDRVLEQVARRYHDAFAPAIERVWQDGISLIRADLREWLRRQAEEADGWVPWRFELSFGLNARHRGLQDGLHDEHSTEEPARLDCGVQLRGKIDLVERNAEGQLRVTDHKTGRVQVRGDAVIDGGRSLQPVFYGLAARELTGAQVQSGRLYYCTLRGGFSVREVPLDSRAEQAAQEVARVVRLALERGFLPAAPMEQACDHCDYRVVCGTREVERVARKGKAALKELIELRRLP